MKRTDLRPKLINQIVKSLLAEEKPTSEGVEVKAEAFSEAEGIIEVPETAQQPEEQSMMVMVVTQAQTSM